MWIISRSYQYAVNLGNASRISVVENSLVVTNQEGSNLLIARYASKARASQVFEDLCKHMFPKKINGEVPFYDGDALVNNEVFYLPEE